MSAKTSMELRNVFGEWLDSLRGQLVEGVYLKDHVLAKALGCSEKTIQNTARCESEPGVVMILMAMANLPRTATQPLIDKLETLRPVDGPVGSYLAEMSQAQCVSAGAFAVLADGLSDNRLDKHEEDAFRFKAREAAREWAEVAMAHA